MRNDQKRVGEAAPDGSSPREPSRREFLGLTLASAALVAPLAAGASVTTRIHTDGTSTADRLEEILARYGSELGHVTSTR